MATKLSVIQQQLRQVIDERINALVPDMVSEILDQAIAEAFGAAVPMAPDKPAPKPKRAAPKPRSRARSEANIEAVRIAAHSLRSDSLEPVAGKTIASRAGLSESQSRNALAVLVERGEVAVQGNGRGTRYLAVVRDKAAE